MIFSVTTILLGVVSLLAYIYGYFSLTTTLLVGVSVLVYGYFSLMTILLGWVSLIAYRLYKKTIRPAGFPPGPRSWPLVGNMLLFAKEPMYRVTRDMTKTYGDIFSIQFGPKWCLMISDIDLARECFIQKAAQFGGRPKSYTVEMFTMGYKDIIFTPYSEAWRLHRKIGFSAIREYASGKKLDLLVHGVLPKLSISLEEANGEPFACKEALSVAVYSVVATMCFGHEYALGDPRLKKWIYLNKAMLEKFGNGLPADFIPILRSFPDKRTKEALALLDEFLGALQEEMKAHRQAYDPENICDLIDSLMLAQQEAIDEGSDKVDSLTDDHLLQTVGDVFQAGTDNTTNTLHWAVALMTKNPDIQTKVAEEVDRVVGRDRLPVISDRGKLPYTEAAIGEVFRMSSVAPLGLTHVALEDTTLGGYPVPKDTWVMANQWAIHHDERYWDEPQKFKPEHFLDESGEVRQHPNGFMPFSFGRRGCLGEAFVKAEMFLLFTWLFQHYTFSAPTDDFEIQLDQSAASITHQPTDFEVVATKRF